MCLVKKDKQWRIYFYEHENVNPGRINVEIIWNVQRFECFRQYFQSFSRQAQYLFYDSLNFNYLKTLKVSNGFLHVSFRMESALVIDLLVDHVKQKCLNRCLHPSYKFKIISLKTPGIFFHIRITFITLCELDMLLFCSSSKKNVAHPIISSLFRLKNSWGGIDSAARNLYAAFRNSFCYPSIDSA